METLLIDLNNEHARRLLEYLQLLGAITIRPTAGQAGVGRGPATFNAIRVSTKDFKFNRKEANERGINFDLLSLNTSRYKSKREELNEQ